MKNSHPRGHVAAIDLGALQEEFTKAKRQAEADAKAYAKAQEAMDRSKNAYGEAQEALRAASRTVLGGA
jgi:hypothetical protein